MSSLTRELCAQINDLCLVRNVMTKGDAVLTVIAREVEIRVDVELDALGLRSK